MGGIRKQIGNRCYSAVLLVIVLALLLSCTDRDTGSRLPIAPISSMQELRQSFNESIFRWGNSGVSDYSVEITKQCNCSERPFSTTKLTINPSLKPIGNDSVGEDLDNSQFDRKLYGETNINTLFLDLANAIEQGKVQSVTYNREYGFPETIVLHDPANRIASHVTISVKSFKAKKVTPRETNIFMEGRFLVAKVGNDTSPQTWIVENNGNRRPVVFDVGLGRALTQAQNTAKYRAIGIRTSERVGGQNVIKINQLQLIEVKSTPVILYGKVTAFLGNTNIGNIQAGLFSFVTDDSRRIILRGDDIALVQLSSLIGKFAEVTADESARQYSGMPMYDVVDVVPASVNEVTITGTIFRFEQIDNRVGYWLLDELNNWYELRYEAQSKMLIDGLGTRFARAEVIGKVPVNPASRRIMLLKSIREFKNYLTETNLRGTIKSYIGDNLNQESVYEFLVTSETFFSGGFPIEIRVPISLLLSPDMLKPGYEIAVVGTFSASTNVSFVATEVNFINVNFYSDEIGVLARNDVKPGETTKAEFSLRRSDMPNVELLLSQPSLRDIANALVGKTVQIDRSGIENQPGYINVARITDLTVPNTISRVGALDHFSGTSGLMAFIPRSIPFELMPSAIVDQNTLVHGATVIVAGNYNAVTGKIEVSTIRSILPLVFFTATGFIVHKMEVTPLFDANARYMHFNFVADGLRVIDFFLDSNANLSPQSLNAGDRVIISGTSSTGHAVAESMVNFVTPVSDFYETIIVGKVVSSFSNIGGTIVDNNGKSYYFQPSYSSTTRTNLSLITGGVNGKFFGKYDPAANILFVHDFENNGDIPVGMSGLVVKVDIPMQSDGVDVWLYDASYDNRPRRVKYNPTTVIPPSKSIAIGDNLNISGFYSIDGNTIIADQITASQVAPRIDVLGIVTSVSSDANGEYIWLNMLSDSGKEYSVVLFPKILPLPSTISEVSSIQVSGNVLPGRKEEIIVAFKIALRPGL